MIISNFKNLATNPLRRKALLVAEAGYKAVDIRETVSQKIKFRNNKLSICGAMTRNSDKKYLQFDLNNYKRVFIVGIGKGSALACLALAKILGPRLTKGIALDIAKPDLKLKPYNLKLLVGTHPLPSKQNIAATQKIIALAKRLDERDLLIIFICGGGSALTCASKKELKQSTLATQILTKAGANIVELNTIRKHLSIFKGGGLAKIAYPATIISLIVSDVLGNNLSIVASGPTVFDKTTKEDVERIWRKYPSNDLASRKIKFRETTKDRKYFKKVKNILFVSNKEAVLAMQKKAEKLGFKTKVYSLALRSEAKNSLLPLVKKVKSGEALLAAGETTVTLRDLRYKIKGLRFGKGGRNTEAVLGYLSNQSLINNISNKSRMFEKNSRKRIREGLENIVITAFASDGRDNTEAAGTLGDIKVLEKARKLGFTPQKYLENHNSFKFFQKTGDLIFVKPQSFNVADLMIVLKSKR